MDDLLQTRHAHGNTAVLLLFNVGQNISVPSTPSEVNGLMDGSWTRGLFTLIHLSLRTLQEQESIKAEIKDSEEMNM